MSKKIFFYNILQSREERSSKRKKFISDYKYTLIQVTVNIPGLEKNNDMVQDIFRECIKSLQQEFSGNLELCETAQGNITGPEGFLSIDYSAEYVKESCITLELDHELGRLWDIDVFDITGESISRSNLSIPPRPCYLCSLPAHQCSRSARHTLEEINKHIISLYYNFSRRRQKNSV